MDVPASSSLQVPSSLLPAPWAGERPWFYGDRTRMPPYSGPACCAALRATLGKL